MRGWRIHLSLWCALALLAACDPDARNDANLFLDRVEQIDTDDPLEDRERMVEALALLPLAAPEVREARRSCVDAHRTMLEAERHTAWVRDRLSEVTDESTLTELERAKIERHLDASGRKLDRSRTMLADCHRLANALRTRFASGRRRPLDD